MTAQQALFGTRLDDEFLAFRIHHPEVISEFVRLAREARNRGQKFGAKALVEVMRWTRPDLAPVNNNLVSRLSRFAMENHRDLDGYFDLRETRS